MTVRWWWYGKLAVFDLAETGRQIGEKLFALLSVSQKKELAQFVRDYEAGNLPTDVPYSTLFRGQYFISPQADQPLTEIQEGDLYFCLEKRLVTVRSQVIPLTVKEFDIFSLLIQHPGRVYSYEVILDLVWQEDYNYYSRKAVNNHISNLRRKIKVAPDVPDYVKSVYGIGYKFEIWEIPSWLMKAMMVFFCGNTYKNTLKNVTTNREAFLNFSAEPP